MMLRRTDTGAIIDVDFWRARLGETAYQRANRIADETKATRNANRPDGWRDVDWRDMIQLSFLDMVDRPTERAAFARLYRVTQRRHRVHAVAVQVWRTRKQSPEESLRDLHARLGLTLEWWDGKPVLLDKDEAA